MLQNAFRKNVLEYIKIILIFLKFILDFRTNCLEFKQIFLEARISIVLVIRLVDVSLEWFF